MMEPVTEAEYRGALFIGITLVGGRVVDLAFGEEGINYEGRCEPIAKHISELISKGEEITLETISKMGDVDEAFLNYCCDLVVDESSYTSVLMHLTAEFLSLKFHLQEAKKIANSQRILMQKVKQIPMSEINFLELEQTQEGIDATLDRIENAFKEKTQAFDH